HLLGVHGHEVAEQHAGRGEEDLAEGDRRELERQAARLPDAALDRLGDLAEVAVARVELAPGLGEPDDGAGQVLGGETAAAGIGAADEEAELRVAVVGESAPDAGRRVRRTLGRHARAPFSGRVAPPGACPSGRPTPAAPPASTAPPAHRRAWAGWPERPAAP